MFFRMWVILILLFWFLITKVPVNAQQTIIIVPSADVLKKGQIYPRVSYRFRPFDSNQYQILTPSLIYGISNTEEVFISVTGLDFVNEVSPSISPAYKKIFQITPTTRYTIGGRIDISLVNSVTPAKFIYNHFSQEIPYTKTRLTAGMYAQSGEHFFSNRTGVLLGFEQYLFTNKLQLDVDWISRNETFGFMAAGFKIRPGRGFVIVPAVLVPNGDNAKFGFIFFVGKVIR